MSSINCLVSVVYGTSTRSTFFSGIFGFLLSIALSVFLIVSMWMIFVKADEPGWKSIIPVYNTYTFFKITWGNGWMFLLLLVPIVNIIVGLMTVYKLSLSFGKGIGFTLGLIFLPMIFFRYWHLAVLNITVHSKKYIY